MTQTSTQWLYDKLNDCFENYDNGEYSYTYFVNESKKILDQAKEMEKKQIIDSYKQGQFDSIPIRETDGEQYFNLIFNQPINK